MSSSFFDTEKSLLEKYSIPLSDALNATLFIKRDDLIDEWVSGNKWRKLKYNVEQAFQLHKIGVLTFGGAFSNHLIATAKACKKVGLKSIGVVRGEELTPSSNSTLQNCSDLGMELLFITREEYKKRNDYAYLASWKDRFKSYLIVPEGGANYHGVIGCQEIMLETPNDFDHVFLAAGTGTTAAGVITAVSPKTQVHVVEVLKGDFLKKEVAQCIQMVYNDKVITDNVLLKHSFIPDSFGGYAKWNEKLIDFVRFFYSETAVKLDLVYTAKVVYAWREKVLDGTIKPSDKVLFIHTGGVQGMADIKDKQGYQLYN